MEEHIKAARLFPHLRGEATVNALPVPSAIDLKVQLPRYHDPDFENLIKILTDMDARTGRPDPSKRPRRVVRKK